MAAASLARVPVLALSATTLGAMCAHAHWYNAKYAHDEPAREEDEIAYRIAESVLYYGHSVSYHGDLDRQLFAKSPQLRLEVTPRIVDVFQYFEGGWVNYMKLPLDSWPAVREQIYKRVRAGRTRVIGYDAEQKRETVVFDLSAHVEINRDGETMIINLAETV